MKQSVDLTKNKLFSTAASSSDDTLTNVIFRLIQDNKRVPWRKSLRDSADFSGYGYSSLVLTGNKKNIARKKEDLHLDKVAVCEQCGVDLLKLPWVRATPQYYLCTLCVDREEEGWPFSEKSTIQQPSNLDVLNW
jgi:hypothetical protein